jgi:drug/metabolite transporter (DMT)-like permease
MQKSKRLSAILQALLVTFLWSTSWVLIKQTLPEIPALTFAGLRYTFAFLILLPGLWKYRPEVRGLSAKDWKNLALLGLVFYTLTQGGQFLTLNYLGATSFSLILNFTTLITAVIGIIILKEIPSRLQWWGIGIFLTGVIVYFFPATILGESPVGLIFAGVTVTANAIAGVLGRSINRAAKISPLVVTVISMGVGAIVLLGVGILIQGLPPLSTSVWWVIIWLAVVNTAFAFLLWNKTLQILTAVESSIINNTMLVQIAVLAWVFLGDRLTGQAIVGLIIASIGILIVNLKPGKKKDIPPKKPDHSGSIENLSG